MRVAERPAQVEGKTSFPILSPEGRMEVLEFDSSDPRLNLSDPRVINFDGRDYLTTLSHLRLLSSEDGVTFIESEQSQPLMGRGETRDLWHRGLSGRKDRGNLPPDLYGGLRQRRRRGAKDYT